MIIIIVISVLLFLITVMIHLFAFQVMNNLILRSNHSHSVHLIYKVIAVIIAHSSQIFIYAVTYYLLTQHFSLGHLSGDISNNFFEYIYYSLVSYTSLGLGDVWPHGPVRLLTGVEAINGLFLIGWSIMYSYPTLIEACQNDEQ